MPRRDRERERGILGPLQERVPDGQPVPEALQAPRGGQGALEVRKRKKVRARVKNYFPVLSHPGTSQDCSQPSRPP